MKIGTKIISLVCIFIMLMAIIIMLGAIQMYQLTGKIKEIAEEATPLVELITEFTIHQLNHTINLERALRYGTAEEQSAQETFKTLKRDYEQRSATEKSWAEQLDRIIQRLTEEPESDARLREFEQAKDIKENYQEYQRLEGQVFDLIAQGDISETEVIVRQMQSLEDQINQQAQILLAAAKNHTQNLVVKAESSPQAVRNLMTVIIIFFSVIAFGLGIFIARGITRPLNTVVGVAEQVAAGDLTVNVPSDNRRDEVGVLVRAFTRMIQSLQETASVAEQIAAGDLTVEVKPQSERDVMGNSITSMVGFFQEMGGVAEQVAAGDLTVEVKPRSEKDVMGNALAGMVENIREQTREIMEGVNVLASSASQISTLVTQFASSAAETATAVSETTATVEEVRQTSEVSSQKARDVSENAQQVAQISQIGEKSTEDTIEEMNRIKEQMESIADSVVTFSEQSQKIGEIIATVDDLTERSNLLAVNASIEAAKAGEQGKGFTVVAEEIKSLAEQSKQATAQVRTILNDIQQATSTAVMVTEQGSKAVDLGMKQSIEAGEAIRELTSSVAESAQAAIQIAASSQQQLVGMDQITLAMESIKQGSDQNVDSAKQLETAAQNLNELGQRLRQLVEQYKV